jgi:hypothetical protein
MIKTFIFFLSFTLLTSHHTHGQDFPEFGEFNSVETAMKECQFDKEADAVILLDYASSYYDDEYHLITDRRVRIKILNQRGLERANIIIPFYSRNDFEEIRSVQGLTYNTDGSSTTKLDKKSVFTEKEDDKYSNVKFALPNVKVGSIIEYKYRSIMKSYGGLDKWLFQADIPTIRSCFKLVVLPVTDFSYVVTKKDIYNVTIIPPNDNGTIYFEMNNLPGLSKEPYMGSVRDYLQKVEFELSAFANTHLGVNEDYNSSWKEVCKNLLEEEHFGGAIKKNIPVPADLAAAVMKENSPVEKMSAIYTYVRDNYQWNGYYSLYTAEGLRKLTETKLGTAGEINLLLINFLQSFNLDVRAMLVAEKHYGKVDPKHIILDRFNKTAAYLSLGGTDYILDATQKYCPATLIPYPLLGTYALVVDKSTTQLSSINPNGQVYKKDITVNARLDNGGLLNGTVSIRSAQYAKESQLREIRGNNEGYIASGYATLYEGLGVSGFTYDYKETDSIPLAEQFNFSRQIDDNGGYLLLNCNLFTELTKNPFTAVVRFSNIIFGYPYNIAVNESIQLPANSKIEQLPKDIVFTTADKSISLTRTIRKTDTTLEVKTSFNQSLTEVEAESYQVLKDFYKSMVDQLNDPVVVKLNK